jgi:ABC-type branched-subunit amino acid transport system substrate-binding protein
MNVRHARRLSAVLAVVLLAASCGGSRGGGDDVTSDTTGPNGEPAVAREASDAGVAKDAVTIGILTSDIDKLVQLGYASDIGDVRSLYETLLVATNASGGINGRRIDWIYEEFDPVAGAQSMQDACDRLFAKATPFVVLTSAGFVDAMPCVTVDHDTPVVSLESFPSSAFTTAAGNLFTIPATSQVSVSAMVDLLSARGDFFGKTVGVLYGDRPGMVETVDTGLIPALRRNGVTLTAKAQITGPSSDPSAFAQFPAAIDTLRKAGVDTLILMHDAFLSTNFVATAAAAGYAPQVLGSDFLHLADPSILPFIENYEAETAFGGMLGVTYTRAGDDTIGESADPIDQGCAVRYDASRGVDNPEYGTQRWSQLVQICNQIDLVLRGVRQAGDNPTRDGFRSALAELSNIHLGFGGQGSFSADKHDGADEFRVVHYDESTKSFAPVTEYAAAGR